MNIIDANAAVGFWPTQGFPYQTLSDLTLAFTETGIQSALVSAVESILFPEPDSYDSKLFEAMAGIPSLRPVKTLNPTLGNWRRSTKEALSKYPIAALKLFPNYHGYSLESEAVADVCRLASQKRLPLLIQMRVNDERNQPRLLQVHGVPADEIVDLSLRFPRNVIIALCAYNHEVATLAKGGTGLLVDLSFLDQTMPLGMIAAEMPEDRYVFGSHTPFLYPHSAAFKLTHCTTSEAFRKKVAAGNYLSASGNCG